MNGRTSCVPFGAFGAPQLRSKRETDAASVVKLRTLDILGASLKSCPRKSTTGPGFALRLREEIPRDLEEAPRGDAQIENAEHRDGEGRRDPGRHGAALGDLLSGLLHPH